MIFCKGKKEEQKEDAEIKDFLCNALETTNLSFLLGSGCSSRKEEKSEKACPLMSDLYKGFLVKENEMKLVDKNIKDVDFNNNLELLFEYMLAIEKVNEKIKIDNKIEENIDKLKKYIYQKIKEGTTDEKVLDTYMDFYSKIFSTQRKNPINIFTTNYDLYNEKSLEKLSFLYNNGFTGTYERKFNPVSYNYIFANNTNIQENIWENVKNYVNLIKLHGSISWIKEGEDIIERNAEKDEFQHLMIYPTPLKDRSTLATPYSDLFRIMQNKITQSNSTLIVIGYGFSDEHINRIVLNALAVESFNLIVFGKSENILKLKEKNIPRISIVYDESENEIKKHYFSEIVKNLFPDISKEIIESKTMNETKKILADIL